MKTSLTLLAPLALAACTTAMTDPETPATDPVSGQSGAMALFPLLDKEAGADSNVVYSPASVDQAFGLLRLGAAGSTADQLDTILPAPKNADFLREDDKGVEVRLANALFLSDQFRFRQSYVDAAKRRYDATARRLNFEQPESAAETINSWADDATDGLISDVISPEAITPDFAAVLANALYFDGKWQTKLTDGDRRNFLFGNGAEKPFKFVGDVLPLSMVEKDGWSAVRLPYSNDRYVMDVIMPTKRKVMDAAPDVARIADLSEALRSKEPVNVALLIPQFEVDYSTGLVPPLKVLGLTAPFSSNEADLSLMAEPGQLPIYVSDARHVTKLQVFDAGTRAAAVTTISIIVTSARIYNPEPIPFHADRPFVMVIRDLKEDQILFVGRIADPQPFEPEVEEPG